VVRGSPLPLKVKRLHPSAVVPRYARAGDAGLDVASVESLTLAPLERAAVRTGIALELPPGSLGFVLPRSGRALREGLTLSNSPGLIDAGYRGELLVAVVNLGSAPVSIAEGDRIAQLLVLTTPALEVVEVTELSPSERGDGGFGHTGRSVLY
jgi:dUTP pyrophosphatase